MSIYLTHVEGAAYDAPEALEGLQAFAAAQEARAYDINWNYQE